MLNGPEDSKLKNQIYKPSSSLHDNKKGIYLHFNNSAKYVKFKQ